MATSPTYIGKTSGSSSGTFTVALPTWQPGDLAVFYTSYSGGGRISAVPAGWTKLAGPASGRGLDLAYRVLQAGDADPTFTTTGEKWALLLYRTVHQTQPIEASAFAVGSANPAVSPTVSASADGALRIHLDGSGGNGGEYPAGMTGRHFHSGATFNAASSWADEVLASAGATGTRSNNPTGSGDWVAWSLVLRVANVAPNAPTALSPDGVTLDRTITQRFSWTFSDPDSSDSQSQYDGRYRLVGAATWTDFSGVTPNTYHDFASGTFAAGDYEWQVRTYDAQGVVGPYSSSAFFTAATPPAGPTITDPIAGGTIASETYPVQWSTPVQDAYQVRTVADVAGSPDATTVYQDSGEVVSSSARSRTVDFPVNNRPEHIQVRIKSGGLWSTWTSINVNVSYTPPATPTARTISSDLDGNVRVEHTNPTPGVGQPTVTSVDVHRRVYGNTGEGDRLVAGLSAGETFTDWSVASQETYEYRLRAYGDNGTSTFSTWTL